METRFDYLVKRLYEEVNGKMYVYLKENQNTNITVSENFQKDFFNLVDAVNFSLMEDKDNFYGYFLFQMVREIRFDISSATAVNFKGAKYVIYFNPLIFLNLSLMQMESTIKHEILHILSMHLTRAKDFKGCYSTLAINVAMDIVVNTYLNHLPTHAMTLEKVNFDYSLTLEPYRSFEYYLEKIQTALDLSQEEDEVQKQYNKDDAYLKTEYNPLNTHDIWKESRDYDEKTLREFALKAINDSKKIEVPAYLDGMISLMKNSKSELPWNLYLKSLMGVVESNRKKTITRRNRRQPDRLDLRGELRDHKAKVAVALDISGSISDEEFMQAIKEVLHIVKNYNHDITIIECDDEIRRIYKVKSEKEVKERIDTRGSTSFSPVFEYANHNRLNLLVYFTDGNGEDELLTIPRGYKVLWVLSGSGDELSIKNPYGPVKKLSKIHRKDNELDMKDVLRDGFSMHNQE